MPPYFSLLIFVSSSCCVSSISSLSLKLQFCVLKYFQWLRENMLLDTETTDQEWWRISGEWAIQAWQELCLPQHAPITLTLYRRTIIYRRTIVQIVQHGIFTAVWVVPRQPTLPVWPSTRTQEQVAFVNRFLLSLSIYPSTRSCLLATPGLSYKSVCLSVSGLPRMSVCLFL